MSFSNLRFFKGLFVNLESFESLFCAFELWGCFEAWLIRFDALVEVCGCLNFRFMKEMMENQEV